MPITPLHLGPGMLLKSILHGLFSLIVFAWAQFLMDIQPILVVVTGKGQLHGFSHTYIGATLIAVFSALSGKYVYQKIMGFIENDFSDYQKKLFDVPRKLTTGVCIVSAFIGAYSHVLLDSIMHADVEPFFPLYLENDLHLLISIDKLMKLCFYSGAVGMLIFFVVRLIKLKK